MEAIGTSLTVVALFGGGLVLLGSVLFLLRNAEGLQINATWSRLVIVAMLVMLFYSMRSWSLPSWIEPSTSGVVKALLWWGVPLVLVGIGIYYIRKAFGNIGNDIRALMTQSKKYLFAFLLVAISMWALLSVAGRI